MGTWAWVLIRPGMASRPDAAMISEPGGASEMPDGVTATMRLPSMSMSWCLRILLSSAPHCKTSAPWILSIVIGPFSVSRHEAASRRLCGSIVHPGLSIDNESLSRLRLG